MRLHNKYTTLGVVLFAALFLLGACGAGLSVQEAELIQEDIQDINNNIAELEEELDNLSKADEDELAEKGESTIKDLMSKLSDIASRLGDIESQLEPPEAPEVPEGGVPTDGVGGQPQ